MITGYNLKVIYFANDSSLPVTY